VGTKISGAFASGGRRAKEYGINLFKDYKAVAAETVSEIRAKPWKGIAAGSLLVGTVYTVKTNPDEQHFIATTLKNQSTLNLISDSIRNPISNDRMQSVMRLFNENRLGRLNFVFFSIIWRRDYGKDCDAYAAQCKVLKPNWRDMNTRFMDLGICGRWIFSELAMRDFDVNDNEFSSSQRSFR